MVRENGYLTVPWIGRTSIEGVRQPSEVYLETIQVYVAFDTSTIGYQRTASRRQPRLLTHSTTHISTDSAGSVLMEQSD